MADPVTDNRNLTLPTVGGDAGTWGGILNSGVMAQLDLILGMTQPISISSADVTLSIPQWNNLAIVLSGTLTADRNLILPFNANSSTVAVGGLFVVDNRTAGAFNVSVKTQAAGSTGVQVPQGVRTLLYSDTVNVWYADDSRLKFIENNGNPNGVVSGVAGSVNNPPSVVWDYTNAILYFCTTTGTTSTAVWTAINPVPQVLPVVTPEGYLTPVSGVPIIPSDSIGSGIIYYTPYLGAWAAIHNGASIIPYQFSELPLTLSASQAASNIYDVFLAYNGGSPVIGTGPSWAAGGGSIAPGSCARGSGAGSAQLQRSGGLWTNAVAISLIYNIGAGNNTISVPANQAIFLGSIWIDTNPGQVTCHRSVGQNRKWGISNAYNTTPVELQVADPTASWGYNNSTIRPSNGNSANSLSTFCCLAQEIAEIEFSQLMTVQSGGNGNFSPSHNLIGLNSTSASTGKVGSAGGTAGPGVGTACGGDGYARTNLSPALGINNIFALEQSLPGLTYTFFGTTANMLMTGKWRA